MEQRRNIEITVFGALVTGEIALVALAATNAGKPSSPAVSTFAATVGITLFIVYTAMIIAIETRNRADRHAYARWEMGRTTEEPLWETIRRAWAAWPIAAAFVITLAAAWTTIWIG
jgi:heme/copper-type cytochrome/quinol oxidase subunit 2